MRIIITLCFLTCFLIEYAQNTYAVDDYFISSNPSAFAEKKLYLSNTFSLANLSSISPSTAPFFNNLVAIRQQVGSFSIGLSNGYNQWMDWKRTGTSISAAYTTNINRKLTLNSGLSASVRRDNLTFIEDVTTPATYFTLWNPPSYDMNIGMSLVHRNWTLGIAGNNLFRSKTMNYPYEYTHLFPSQPIFHIGSTLTLQNTFRLHPLSFTAIRWSKNPMIFLLA